MLNFTVGPVQSCDLVRQIGGEQVPYFRTAEFSEIMMESQQLMKEFANADENAKVLFITGSGTASMEAAVMNVLDENDKVLVVNGGSFGQRFVEICKIHQIPYEEIKPDTGKVFFADELETYAGRGFTSFLVNIHETSTGVHYDLDLISDFCARNNLILIVDAISSFLADPIDMTRAGIDVLITGSQKALACPPGVSIIVLSEKAVQRVNAHNPKSLYFDLKTALKEANRGQTPFTPAVGILLQINARLKQIQRDGGVDAEVQKTKELAEDFRERIRELPVVITSDALSNAVTPLHPLNVSAYDVFLVLKDQYNIWVCPNGGELADKIFRVGHIGALTKNDNTVLVDALKDMNKRGLL